MLSEPHQIKCCGHTVSWFFFFYSVPNIYNGSLFICR